MKYCQTIDLYNADYGVLYRYLDYDPIFCVHNLSKDHSIP